MNRQIKALAQLQKLAQLRSDLEMRSFSVFRAHVAAAQARLGMLEDDLQQLYHVTDAFTIAGARLTNALTTDKVHEIRREEALLRQMQPRFESARQKAMREFGRAQVLQQMHDDLVRDARQIDQRKQQ